MLLILSREYLPDLLCKNSPRCNFCARWLLDSRAKCSVMGLKICQINASWVNYFLFCYKILLEIFFHAILESQPKPKKGLSFITANLDAFVLFSLTTKFVFFQKKMNNNSYSNRHFFSPKIQNTKRYQPKKSNVKKGAWKCYFLKR